MGISAVWETLDTAVKSQEELARLTRQPVLSVIPFILTREEKGALFFKRWAIVLGCAGAVFLALVLVHTFVMPIEVLWAKVERKMMVGL